MNSKTWHYFRLFGEQAKMDLPLMKTHKSKDPLEGVDLQKEYELIKQKKSKLSANQRGIVVYLVERGVR